MWVLPRGHDKTTSLGRLLNWALAFSKRKVYCVGAAGDRDQASRLAEFMKTESQLNPWLDERLEFANYLVRNPKTGSRLQIISADANSSFGDKSDICVCDEVTHWDKPDLWQALYSGSEKRPNSVYLIITNAGMLHTWQHELRELALRSPNWFVYEAPGPIASWMSAQGVDELARSLPRQVAQRVLFNRWLDPSEGMNFVTSSQVDACVSLAQASGLSYRTKAICDGVEYIAGIDYGPTKDRTVMAVGHREHSGAVIIDRMDVLQGSHDAPVPISSVEEWMEDVYVNFRRPTFVVDEYQLQSTIQKYLSRGYDIEKFETRSGKGNYELAQNLSALIANGKFLIYPECGMLLVQTAYRGVIRHSLPDELKEVVLKPTNYGYRIDHERTKHDDRVVCAGMIALALAKKSMSLQVDWSNDIFW